MIYHRKTPDDVFRCLMPAQHPPFLPFRDASFGTCSFNLTLQHCFTAVYKVHLYIIRDHVTLTEDHVIPYQRSCDPLPKIM